MLKATFKWYCLVLCACAYCALNSCVKIVCRSRIYYYLEQAYR